jgi:hypothetical protein
MCAPGSRLIAAGPASGKVCGALCRALAISVQRARAGTTARGCDPAGLSKKREPEQWFSVDTMYWVLNLRSIGGD